jgi:eukaryotic-like serine/threonine-protein kinase
MSGRLVKDYEPLPGYRLIERLGRGGFGEVWKVEAPGQLFKAMKFVFGNLDSQDESDGRPAEQELKALNRVKAIRHPYILSLERIDIIDGQLLIVMELADKSIWDKFREYRQLKMVGIPRDELLMYLTETAEALDLMNDDHHIQHLDVKPQNLFLIGKHVKVADFGLAKAFEGGRGTITGGVTPVYAAPETFEGYVSRFTDQYSLAICFQELLTGTRPFNGSNTKQLLMQHLNGVPDLNSLPPGDRPIIARALSKKPDDR